jgi:hypothetical protein
MVANTETEVAQTPESGSEPILSWEAKEFAEYARDKRWYTVVLVAGIVLAFGAVVLALLSKSLRDGLSYGLVAVVFALGTYVVLKHADDAPRMLTYSISKLGVTVGNTFHPYGELRQYWLIYKPPVKTLHIQRINRYRPILRIDMADVDPLAIREALRPYLPEDTKRAEDFLDKFSRFIRL